MPRKKQHRKKHRFLAGFLILCIAVGGAWGIWEVSEIMAAETRSGQSVAAFSVRDGVAVYSLFGREGEIALPDLRTALAKACTSLPAAERLLFWGAEGADSLWQEYLLPLGRQYLAPVLRQLAAA